jgi:hypothetical protein
VIIIPPFEIDDSRFVSSNIPEPDTSVGEIAWAANTAYVVGDKRIRTTTHRIYQALVAIPNTVTTPPENDPQRWVDIGPTNRFAMFDYDRNTASGRLEAISATVKSGGRATSIVLFGIDAQFIAITVRDGLSGPIVYERSYNLQERFVSNWTSHFFAPFVFRESLVLIDVPPYFGAHITVTISKNSPTERVFLESMVIGSPVKIGRAKAGAESDILDFSRVERDAFGNATLVPRKNVPTLSAQVLADKADVPAIRKLRQDYAGRPLVFLAIEDGEDQYFDSLSLVGIFKRMAVVVEYPQHALVNIEAEGI